MNPMDNLTLAGRRIRLEPLAVDHVPALVAAASESRVSYLYSIVPDGERDMRAYVDAAIDARAAGEHLPFATVRVEDERVIGTTRFSDLTPWVWPEGSDGRCGVGAIGLRSRR